MDKRVKNDAEGEKFCKNNEKETSTTNEISKFDIKNNRYEFPIVSNQSDRVEALKCIEKALAAFPKGQYEKAEHFLRKSLRICESSRAKLFLEFVCNEKTQTNSNENAKTEKNNEHVNNHYLNKLATKANAEKNFVKAESFLIKDFLFNPNDYTREQLKHVQDIRASQHSSDKAITKKKKFVSFAADAKTSNKIDEARNYGEQELEKQRSEKTRNQIDKQKSFSKYNTNKELDKADNFKPIGDLENISETVQECIEKAQNAFEEDNYHKAIRLLKKSERIYPTAKAKDLMEQVKQKLIENGENPDKVLKEPARTNSIVNKAAGVETPQVKKKVVTSEHITEIKRVKKANDDYEILGMLQQNSD